MFEDTDLIKHLVERRIERLGIDALYADETELGKIDAVRQELEDVITDILEPIQDLDYDEFTNISYPFGYTFVTNLPSESTAVGRDIVEYFRENRIPFE